MLKYLLDTNAASALVRGRNLPIRQRFNDVPSERVAISVITEAEIRFGIAKKQPTPALGALVAAFLNRIEILPWSSVEAMKYAEMRSAMASKGKVLSELDSLIAAHALSANCTLVTADKAFSMVPNLKTENWDA